MKRHSDSSTNNKIKSSPSQQDILITEVNNLTYDVKFMKDLVKPLHEQNNKLKSTIHDLTFKVEDQFEGLMVNFSQEQQFKSRTSERAYTMGIIKEKMEEQIQTIDQLGEQQKNSQKDYQFQQKLFQQKDQELLNLQTQHQSENMKIMNECENKVKDMEQINQNFLIQINEKERKIQYQDNQIEKVIESRMVDKLKEMVKLSKQVEDLKEQIVDQENLHQEQVASMKLQYEKEKKQLQVEFELQQYKIETKYKKAYQQNSQTEDQIFNLQQSNKTLKVDIDTQEKQINSLKCQKMTIHSDLNKEKKERAQDNKQHKENEQIIQKLKDNEESQNRLIKRLEDQTLKNQAEFEQKLQGRNKNIQEQNDYVQQQYYSICQLQQQIVSQKASYEEEIMIQKIKFYKQLGYPTDDIKKSLTHDFEQVQQEEQSNKYQQELANYKNIVQKDQQALNTQQEEAITQIFKENNLKIQNLQYQHDQEMNQIKQGHLSLEQRLSEANQSIMTKLQEIQLIKQDSVEKQNKLQQEIIHIQCSLEKQAQDQEKQAMDYEQQKQYDTSENEKQHNNLLFQIEEKVNQITQLENLIIKQNSQQQAKLHEIQEQKQQILNSKRVHEHEGHENKKQQDHIKKLEEKLRLLSLEVENNKIIYNIFRQKSQSTDLFEAHQIGVLQQEQKLRYKSQLQTINKSIAQKFHRTYTQKI